MSWQLILQMFRHLRYSNRFPDMHDVSGRSKTLAKATQTANSSVKHLIVQFVGTNANMYCAKVLSSRRKKKFPRKLKHVTE